MCGDRRHQVDDIHRYSVHIDESLQLFLSPVHFIVLTYYGEPNCEKCLLKIFYNDFRRVATHLLLLSEALRSTERSLHISHLF